MTIRSLDNIEISSPKSYSLSLCIFLCVSILILPSPVLLHFGIRGIHTLPISILAIGLYSVLLNRKFKKWVLQLTFFILLFAFFSVLYWKEYRIILLPFWIISALLSISITTQEEISRSVDLLSWMVLALLIGAIIGFFLALGGMLPIANLSDKWGTTMIYSYGFTLTNMIYGNIIRPAGIFDEPGAFSFFICVTVFFRHILGKKLGLTVILLVLGFITFSLMHLLFSLLFLASFEFKFKNFFLSVIFLAFTFLLLISTGILDVFDVLLNSRFMTFYDTFGDNERYLAFQNCIKVLTNNWWALIFGINSNCLFEIVLCVSDYGIICCNPLEPLTSSGILLSWPYYFGLLYLSIQGLRKRKNLLFIGFVLIFLQRPGIHSPGYSLCFALAIWVSMRLNKKSINF